MSWKYSEGVGRLCHAEHVEVSLVEEYEEVKGI
jgi:hypothetical protein